MNSGNATSAFAGRYANPEPSRPYTAGRCRDYRSAAFCRKARLITGQSVRLLALPRAGGRRRDSPPQRETFGFFAAANPCSSTSLNARCGFRIGRFAFNIFLKFMAGPAQDTIVCCQCTKEFTKRTAEIRRSNQLGRSHYCSLRCSGLANRHQLPISPYPIKQHAANRADEFTGFREHLRRCRKRGREATITLFDLKSQWNTQGGRCPYTGLLLEQPSYLSRNDVQRTASLDRIDSSKDYIVGNIQFVSMAINYAKSTLSHEQMVELCRTVAAFWSGR